MKLRHRHKNHKGRQFGQHRHKCMLAMASEISILCLLAVCLPHDCEIFAIANPTRYPLHHHLRIQRVCPKKRPNEDKCREFDECCQLSAASPRHKKSHSGKLLTDYSLFGLRFVSTHSQKLGTVLYMGIMFYITHVLLRPNYQLVLLYTEVVNLQNTDL